MLPAAEAVRPADAVIILAPNDVGEHLKLAAWTLPAGKPTLIDKFLAPTVKEAKEIVSLSKRHNAPIFSSSSLRYAVELEAAMDELMLRVEANAETFKRADTVQKFRSEVEHKIQKVLGLRTLVEIAEPNSIPRTDFKARRVIDDRAVFRDMHKHIEEAKT